MTEQSKSGSDEVVILIKAAPNATARGETVCCAGLDIYGNWRRLYPIAFRRLTKDQQFGRWDQIRYNWRKPKDDGRFESQRVDQDTIRILRELKQSERASFVDKAVVSSLVKEREQGRSLAVIRPEILGFSYERKPQEEFDRDRRSFELLARQVDLFAKELAAYQPCPYRFIYRYRTEDGDRQGTCQDWEIEATFFRWSRLYGEQTALERMIEKFGVEYPRLGMVLAMGTHSRYPDVWLINGVLRVDRLAQPSLF
ncbi:hypothetical protein OSH11_13675 [Kaistia dalseonensis]|uniref:Uncharacterized protein n=1 Tax=Kaistia dalseonensis TaxID=410840 RepID=A0ABU0H915_9HYPH|nr:hypothetical protein [Kaistia dalseonensis]MCX5495758.1 hypothetical protein [Kaistia dalseonensis]MDQ0438358.1 hypothetical protein [Kaistia dalseonensis]